MIRTHALAAFVIVLAAARFALASEPVPFEVSRAPIAEPILTETVTDIDGTEAGEVEVEANGAFLRSLRGGGRALDTSVEVEWLVSRSFGLRAEPGVGQDGGASGATTAAGVGVGASWKWIQDFEHDFHADAELATRLPWESSPIIQPGDAELPVAIDARAALRRGVVTMRWSVGVGMLAHPEHAPLRGSLAALFPFESSGKFGFWGLEVDGDGARATPFVTAIDIVPNFEPAGLPLRVGLALPWVIGAGDDRPTVGLYLRVFYESEREIEFAAPAAHDVTAR